ncbi:MAG: site-specific integrase [Planctomycetota bacterium]
MANQVQILLFASKGVCPEGQSSRRAVGNLSKEQQDRLWDALYLRRTDIDDILDHVRDTATKGYIYPLFVMAPHTGARRSEMIRSQRIDFDFDNEVVTIREKNRVHGTMTTRRVPTSPLLASTMQDWFTRHPNSIHTFSPDPFQTDQPDHSREPITKDQAHNHFKQTLAKSKWKKIRGWHCFRHSFISNLACEGVDQRIIDEFVGHTTEQMRRRYRHLFPNVKKEALLRVFG